MEHDSAHILEQKRTADTHNTHEWPNHYSEHKNPDTEVHPT